MHRSILILYTKYTSNHLTNIGRYFECSRYDGEDPVCSFGEGGKLSYQYHLDYFNRNILDRGNACNHKAPEPDCEG